MRSYVAASKKTIQRSLQWSLGVVERCERNSMARGNGLNFINPLRGDESPSLGERLKAVLQSESHAFEQTAVDHVGKWMAIEDSMKIGSEGSIPP